jgi:hypothetical protein
MTNTNGTTTALDNWTKGMEITYDGKQWQIGWKGIVKNSGPGKNPYRAVLIRNNNRLWTDGTEVDAIIAEMQGTEEEENSGNLDINGEEIALILQALFAWKKELLAYTKRSGVSRFKVEEAAGTIKAVNALREKLATIQD